jgi:hypothetical protein
VAAGASRAPERALFQSSSRLLTLRAVGDSYTVLWQGGKSHTDMKVRVCEYTDGYRVWREVERVCACSARLAQELRGLSWAIWSQPARAILDLDPIE